jgi:hypothetical protein
LVGHQVRFFGNVGADNWRDSSTVASQHVEAADLAGIAIKQRKNGILVSGASALLSNALHASNVGFVNFYSAAIGSHGRHKAASAHCFTQAVHQNHVDL